MRPPSASTHAPNPAVDWHDAIRDYCRGHIRKVTRRARGAHWVAAQELPGITVDLAGTQVRALVPGLVSELDPRISRLQVGGTDVPPDDPPAVDTPAGPVLTVDLAAASPMTLGKAMAQTGHAGMIAVALLAADDREMLAQWTAAGCPAIAHRATDQQWAELSAQVSAAGSGVAGRAVARRPGRRLHRGRPGHRHGHRQDRLTRRVGRSWRSVPHQPQHAIRMQPDVAVRPGMNVVAAERIPGARQPEVVEPRSGERPPAVGDVEQLQQRAERMPAQHRQDPGIGQFGHLGRDRGLEVRQRAPDRRSGA